MVKVLGLDPSIFEAPPDGLRGEPGPVLDSIESLFLDSGNKLAIHDERSCSVTVIRVQSENGSHRATWQLGQDVRVGGTAEEYRPESLQAP